MTLEEKRGDSGTIQRVDCILKFVLVTLWTFGRSFCTLPAVCHCELAICWKALNYRCIYRELNFPAGLSAEMPALDQTPKVT